MRNHFIFNRLCANLARTMGSLQRHDSRPARGVEKRPFRGEKPIRLSTGREWDKEIGLYYYRARYYDPMEGRFISKDPIGFNGGDVNLYRMVQNGPVNFIDPWGLARFAFRPLSGFEESYNTPDGSSNHHTAHEQLWFDDNPSSNVGFFAGDGDGFGPAVCGESGNVRSDNGHSRSEYDFFGPVYDDAIMREALSNISGRWDDTPYCLSGRNCQHFADSLRREYNRLTNNIDIDTDAPIAP